MKYYAVKKGYNPGIYESWTECQEQTSGFSGAVFKGFIDRAEAEAYLKETDRQEPINNNLPFAYIDGSYNKAQGLYSWGGFINNNGNIFILQGTGNAADYLKYRNITGEVRGAIDVIQQAVKLGIPEINLYYDYNGVEQWANDNWKCKTELSQFYRNYYLKHRNRVKINFIHVDGHTGIYGNEIADYLAKEAAGAKLRKKDIAALAEFREAAAQPADTANKTIPNSSNIE